MASAIQTILDGDKNVVVKVTGNGAVTAELIVDVSALVPSCTRVRLHRLQASVVDTLAASLLWDADTDLVMVHLTSVNQDMDFKRFGGLINNAGTGVTGDVLLTTVGTGNYTFNLEFYKTAGIDTN